MECNTPKNSKVSIWLLIGISMVFIQIIIGGITRLTDSGLSITEWSVIKGTLPPLNEKEWLIAFEKYKNFATKQYESLHSDMSLSQFKYIYFWEYFHRLWARLMGFVFIFPFFYFLFKKQISSSLRNQLLKVVVLASIVATFGWIMVASGLNDDNRTWVSAYKLLGHLILASMLFIYLNYIFYSYISKDTISFNKNHFIKPIGILIVIQIAFGALMAGMKAGLIFPYPTIIFKLDIFQEIIKNSPTIKFNDFINYEPNPTIKLIIQVLHRVTAYLLGSLIIIFCIANINNTKVKLFLLVTIIQISIGIVTVSLCQGEIPVFWGVIHQAIAFVLLSTWVNIYQSSIKK
jgi:cytochrome c oxidase assembly protein subunit 15